MKRKIKSTREPSPHLVHKLCRMTSVNYQPEALIQQQDGLLDVANLIEEILSDVHHIVHQTQAVWLSIQSIRKFHTSAQDSLILMGKGSEVNEEPKIICEDEPAPVVNLYNYKAQKSCYKQLISSRTSRTKVLSLEPHSLPFNEEQKYLKMHRFRMKQLKQDRDSVLLPLISINRHSQDHSSQIQELLRRKKELQHCAKTERRLTQEAKVLLSKKKEGALFYHDDDGEAVQIKVQPRSKQAKRCKPGEARFIPGETMYEGMKKRPIVEMIACKKKKKRKNIGDTCLMLEQIKDTPSEPRSQRPTFKMQPTIKSGVKFRQKDSGQSTPWWQTLVR